MILNYNEPTALEVYECDICIVGSGAAALALLTRFYNTSYQVVVIEAGGENITSENQKIYDTVTSSHPLPGAQEGRFRVFGGSTVKWGGQSLPLDPIDFTKRSWVPFSGWPISYEEVARYYPEVDDFLGLESNSYDSDIYKLIGKKGLKVTDDLNFRFSKWSPKPNIREKYRKKIIESSNIKLLQNANLVAINSTDSHENVDSLTITNFVHKKGKVRAKRYIIACGGIENARLLLASNQQNPKGVGNNYDVVGRFLQDHPNAYIGTILNSTTLTQQYFNYFFIRKTRCLPRFILSECFQKNHELLNTSASILFFPQEDNAYSKILDIYRKQARGSLELKDIKLLIKLSLQAHQLVKPLTSMLWHKKVFTPNPCIKLNLMMETPPDWNNRVSLTENLDALGMPIAAIDWKLNEQIRYTLIASSKLFAEYFPQLGLGSLQTEDWINSSDWATRVKDAYHHIGTTRMSDSPREGVVNSNCKVFGLENLYMAGSSVFPTSGHSNPTATLIALAFRLSEHIKTTLIC